jgi:hypothetical protein
VVKTSTVVCAKHIDLLANIPTMTGMMRKIKEAHLSGVGGGINIGIENMNKLFLAYAAAINSEGYYKGGEDAPYYHEFIDVFKQALAMGVVLTEEEKELFATMKARRVVFLRQYIATLQNKLDELGAEVALLDGVENMTKELEALALPTSGDNVASTSGGVVASRVKEMGG